MIYYFRPSKLIKLFMSRQSHLGWEEHCRQNKRKRTWKAKSVLWRSRLAIWKIRWGSCKRRSTKWKSMIGSSKIMTHRLIRTISKRRKEPIRFSRKNLKNYCKVLRPVKNDDNAEFIINVFKAWIWGLYSLSNYFIVMSSVNGVRQNPEISATNEKMELKKVDEEVNTMKNRVELLRQQLKK